MKGQKTETAAAPNRLEGIRTQRRRSPGSPEGSWPGRRIAFAHFIPGTLEVDAHPHPYSPEELGKLPRNIAEQLPELVLAFQEDVRAALAASDNRLANKLGSAFAPKHGAGKAAIVVRVDWFQTGARIKHVRDLETQLVAVLDKLAENGDGKGVYAGDLNGDKRFGFTVWADAAPAAKGLPEVKDAPEKLEKREELSHNEPVPRSPKPTTVPPSLDEKVKAVFAGLSKDAKECLEQVAARIDAFRQAGTSRSLEPLRTFLAAQNPETLKEKKALGAFLSNFLERLGATIGYRERPCALFVAVSEDYPDGRFLIVPHGSSKALFSRVHFPDVLSELQPLKLVEMVPPLEESPKEWRDRINHKATRTAGRH